MISFTDQEMKIITEKAQPISAERRSIYLNRIVSMMKFRPRTIADLTEVCELAGTGIHQQYDGFCTGLPEDDRPRASGPDIGS